MDKEQNKICPKGYHYHPEHPKSDKNGCMKDEDMKESFSGTMAIYNTIRCSSDRRLNNTTSYIGV
jgi:hypothetical protein